MTDEVNRSSKVQCEQHGCDDPLCCIHGSFDRSPCEQCELLEHLTAIASPASDFISKCWGVGYGHPASNAYAAMASAVRAYKRWQKALAVERAATDAGGVAAVDSTGAKEGALPLPSTDPRTSDGPNGWTEHEPARGLKPKCAVCNDTGSNCAVYPIEGCKACDGERRSNEARIPTPEPAWRVIVRNALEKLDDQVAKVEGYEAMHALDRVFFGTTPRTQEAPTEHTWTVGDIVQSKHEPWNIGEVAKVETRDGKPWLHVPRIGEQGIPEHFKRLVFADEKRTDKAK